ncbi:MAG: PIG-L family deacetylase [Verrucomicrobiota bacterium]
MNPYHHLISEYVRLTQNAKQAPLGTFQMPAKAPVPAGAPTVLIFSPHPDDEVIIGGLALRLLRQSHWRVVNVAVTQGSKKERQAARFQELKNCCDYIGFGLVQTAPNGLEGVNPKSRVQTPAAWADSVKAIAEALSQHRPRVILFPHELDWNSTHIGTHFLVMDALRTLPPEFTCYTVETEFWGQMATPNLMVELGPTDLADLITALTFHVGEVQRNPYHLSLPAWMMDNVRRGSELVGGQGGAAPDYLFATLYRLRRWQNGRISDIYAGGRQVTSGQDPAVLFP